MPEYVVHLHKDVFYDIQVTADNDDDALDKAIEQLTDEHIDTHSACPIELSDAIDTPIHLVTETQRFCNDPTCEYGDIKHG